MNSQYPVCNLNITTFFLTSNGMEKISCVYDIRHNESKSIRAIRILVSDNIYNVFNSWHLINNYFTRARWI